MRNSGELPLLTCHGNGKSNRRCIPSDIAVDEIERKGRGEQLSQGIEAHTDPSTVIAAVSTLLLLQDGMGVHTD